jgi:hypothetical protein
MANRRLRTIGTNPLDAVIPEPRPTVRDVPSAQAPAKVPKERLTVHLPVDLIDQVKNAVYWTPGLTLAAFAEQAMRRELLERQEARGEPFPPRTEALRSGRPLK